MIAFGQYLTRNRLNGIWVTLLLAALANFGLPTFWMALLVLSFITLRRGPQEGFIILLFGILPALIGLYFTREATLLNSLFFTIPIFLGTLLTYALSVMLNRTYSWRLVLSISVYVSFFVILAVFLINPDVVDWWKTQMTQSMEQFQNLLGANAENLDMQLLVDRAAAAFSGLVTAYYLLSVLLTILVARWWQARVFNPGGFNQEWLNLSLDRISGLIFILSIVAYLIFKHAFTLNVMLACLVPFAIVGISIIHASIKRALMDKATIALIIFYVALLFLALYLVGFLAILGAIDCFYRFKR